MINLTKIVRTALLLTGMPQLRQVETSCQQIILDIDARFQAMPRSSTCAHSKVPEGRTFCDYYKKCCIGYCNRCENFENRY